MLPCHGCSIESTHNATELGTGGHVMLSLDNIHNMNKEIDEIPKQKKNQNPTTESSLDQVMSPVVTRK